jgi:hypothetical protein
VLSNLHERIMSSEEARPHSILWCWGGLWKPHLFCQPSWIRLFWMRGTGGRRPGWRSEFRFPPCRLLPVTVGIAMSTPGCLACVRACVRAWCLLCVSALKPVYRNCPSETGGALSQGGPLLSSGTYLSITWAAFWGFSTPSWNLVIFSSSLCSTSLRVVAASNSSYCWNKLMPSLPLTFSVIYFTLYQGLFWGGVLFFVFCGAEDGTQGLMYARQVLCHWATSNFLVKFFILDCSIQIFGERQTMSTALKKAFPTLCCQNYSLGLLLKSNSPWCNPIL